MVPVAPRALAPPLPSGLHAGPVTPSSLLVAFDTSANGGAAALTVTITASAAIYRPARLGKRGEAMRSDRNLLVS